MAINCETALELLSASMDGELTPDQEPLLQAHLDQCPHCRALQVELIGLHTACGTMEVLPPAQLKEQIMANLPPQRPAKVIYWKRWGAMAAALTLVALAAWRLPHSFYDKPVPAADINATQQPASDPESAPEAGDVTAGSMEDLGQPSSHGIVDMSINTDTHILPDNNSDDLDAFSIPADTPNMTGRAAKRSTPVEEASKDDAPESDEVLLTAAAGGGGEPQDNAVSPQAAAPQVRVALFSAIPDDPVYAIDPGDTDLVTEPDPLDGEAPIAAQPLEIASEDVRDFSRYSAVIVLTGSNFEGDYPRQRQENGDMWYLLPRDQLDSLPQTLGEGSTAYELRLEGDDLTSDAPYILLIVSGDN